LKEDWAVIRAELNAGGADVVFMIEELIDVFQSFKMILIRRLETYCEQLSLHFLVRLL